MLNLLLLSEMVNRKDVFLFLGVEQKKCRESFLPQKKSGAAAQRKRRFSLHTSRIKRSILFLIFLSVVVVVSPEREREKEKEERKYREKYIFFEGEKPHGRRRTEREREKSDYALVSFFVRR